MEAETATEVAELLAGELAQPTPASSPESTAVERRHRAELIVEALQTALAGPQESRLYRSGKLGGLFPRRSGISGNAATTALEQGLFQIVRTEVRGRQLVEWVRATPRGVEYLHEHDSPVAVLRDLRSAIGATRDGVPVWMAEAKTDLAIISERFEQRAIGVLARLEELSKRVEAALRRADLMEQNLPESLTPTVPWGMAALMYLDRRAQTLCLAECPLRELFDAVREVEKGLTLRDFHDGLRRLQEFKAVRLVPPSSGMPDPEFALQLGAEFCSSVVR